MRESLARAQWVGFSTMVIREFNRILRIWGQTIVPPVVTATLYFVIFGSLIGRRVGQVIAERDLDTAGRRPGADQGAHERGLAGAGRAEDGEELPGVW